MNDAAHDRQKARYEADFQPPIPQLPPEHRIAHALEYIAYQMGQMNRKLDRILDVLEAPAKEN